MGVDFATHEQRYKNLSKDLKGSLDLLLLEIRKLRQSNPALRVQIELIEKFLADLEQFILTPRIVQVEKQVMVDKIVEKDRLVHLPKADDRSVKMELTLSLLVEKLIVELKRLKKDYPNINFNLEDDVRLIFFTELDGSRLAGEEMNSKLKSFADMIYRKFEAAGNWSADQQLMLNSFLQERFLMANLVRNANLEIERSKTFTVEREESMKRYQADLNALQTFLSKIRATMSNDDHSIEQNSLIINIFREYDAYASTKTLLEPMITLGDVQVNDQRIQSLLREKDAEIFKLREKIYAI